MLVQKSEYNGPSIGKGSQSCLELMAVESKHVGQVDQRE